LNFSPNGECDGPIAGDALLSPRFARLQVQFDF
jgi:hypothetical protein